ncbi:MAG: hypothetical protein AW08_01656 [Candidatus Accumulibacter adjunctus]|uniref:Uncharacterized protein n=1 Tax=Candidatus Accumulibacter adjunctus TaxID=1454001 RepID=A0A011NT55_9PROT|nr:MAG: hypothetical protein AW08_01656 [Candidatus Accumulibacter adjunctus]
MQLRGNRLVQGGDAVVVEARRHRAEDRHLVGALVEGFVVALVLLADVAQGVVGALAVELVDRHEIGKIEHVDLLELRRGAELRSHDVQRDVDQGHDGGVALADSRGLDDDQIEARELAGGDHFRQGGGEFRPRVARRQRAHVDVRMLDGVHPDAVTQQRTAGALARRVDGDDRQLDAVALIEPKAPHQFVGQRRLAGATGTGDAERRHLEPGGSMQQFLAQRFGVDTVLECRDDLRQVPPAAGLEGREHRVGILRCQCRQVVVGFRDDLVDHSLQTHRLPVLRGIDARHAVGVQFSDLAWHDDAATATENLDVLAAAGAQQVDHVLEELDVAALVGSDGDPLHIFLQGRVDDLLDGAVVAKMNHLGARRLQDAAHDVDRCIVPVEQ